MKKALGMAPIKGPKYGMIFVIPTMKYLGVIIFQSLLRSINSVCRRRRIMLLKNLTNGKDDDYYGKKSNIGKPQKERRGV